MQRSGVADAAPLFAFDRRNLHEKVLMIVGSLRKNSFNYRLAKQAEVFLEAI